MYDFEFDIGDRVRHADVPDFWNVDFETIFVVIKRELEDGAALYTLRLEQDNGQSYEAWEIDLIRV